MSIHEYRKKRRFDRTTEPKGTPRRPRITGAAPIFVVQQHHATRLHWDFRLEEEGVLKSWAVTREPTVNPADKHLAIETEDHPLEYGRFHGRIPSGQYGAGIVKIWDRGIFEAKRSMAEMLRDGLVEVTLRGRKLKGRYVLVRIRGEGPKAQWLFFKAKSKVVGLRVPKVA